MPTAEAAPVVDVLVVEDEAPVRSLMCDVLKRAGYTVCAVAEGDAALTVLRERHFLAMICDLGMPLVNGIQLFERLSDLDPDLTKRVLFVTGISDAPAVTDFIKRTGRPVLPKPFDIRALVRAVAHLVGRRPTPGRREP